MPLCIALLLQSDVFPTDVDTHHILRQQLQTIWIYRQWELHTTAEPLVQRWGERWGPNQARWGCCCPSLSASVRMLLSECFVCVDFLCILSHLEKVCEWVPVPFCALLLASVYLVWLFLHIDVVNWAETPVDLTQRVCQIKRWQTADDGCYSIQLVLKLRRGRFNKCTYLNEKLTVPSCSDCLSPLVFVCVCVCAFGVQHHVIER